MTREWCVIFNPTAGRHRARQRLQQWQKQLADRADFRPTQAAGHARELAKQAVLEGYQVVGAAGGDGTVHEVLNGLMEAQHAEVRLGLLPIGSANDFAFSLEAGKPTTPDVRTIDVGSIRATTETRAAYFGCSAGVGFNACVTVESRRVRRLQGLALYGVAALRALMWHFRCPPMELAFDDESPRTLPTLMLSLLNGRREGNFPMAPQADLSDGLLDFVHAGALSRWQVLRLLPRLSIAGPPRDYPGVRQGRCRRVHIRSRQPLNVHLDGEFFCREEDGLSEFEITLRPGALQVDLSLVRRR